MEKLYELNGHRDCRKSKQARILIYKTGAIAVQHTVDVTWNAETHPHHAV